MHASTVRVTVWVLNVWTQASATRFVGWLWNRNPARGPPTEATETISFVVIFSSVSSSRHHIKPRGKSHCSKLDNWHRHTRSRRPTQQCARKQTVRPRLAVANNHVSVNGTSARVGRCDSRGWGDLSGALRARDNNRGCTVRRRP